MFRKLYNFVLPFFRGHERSVKAKKNILFSILIKGGSIVIGFLLVPIALGYLDKTQYGIWLVLSSFLTWFTFFEIGLGNGLRNKLAEALAKNDYQLGKHYVSTTYAILTLIIAAVSLIFFVSNTFINWPAVLNVDASMANELGSVALIVFGSFFLKFVLKLLNMIFLADQKPAISNALGPIGNLLALIVIYILTKTTEGSLLNLAFVLSISPVIILTLASAYFFLTKYKHISPSINYVKLKYAKDLLTIGSNFFIIQISALVMFQSSNFLLAQYFGPEMVVPYNIAFKYFSVITMGFTIIISPYWSAITEAWVKEEINWIKNTIKKLLYVWVGFLVLAIALLMGANSFYEIWLGEKQFSSLNISFSLNLLISIQFLLFTLGGVFNVFINGVGKIKVQMISLIIGAILFVPMVIFFIKILDLGIISVVIATIIANFYSPIIAPIQYYKIINKKAHGIWNS